MKIPFVDLKAQYRSIQTEIDAAIRDVVENTAFIEGPRLEAFEKDFAAFCRAPHCAGVGSGTDALYLALKAMGIGPGDEVITVSHTYIATAEAISFAGAKPVFVDIETDTMLMDARQIDAAITPRTKAILPVHLYGQLVDMDAVLAVAQKHRLLVLEDCAQGHAAELDGRRSPIGPVAAFSFYPGKNLGAYGDAGGVVTRDPAIHKYITEMRNHGREKKAKYEHARLGFGFRLDTLQAAILRAKLPHLESWTEKRRAHARHYSERLKGVLEIPIERPGRRHVFHVYAVRTDQPAALREHLEAAGVATNCHYPIPVHLQPAYAFLGMKRGAFPLTETCVDRLLSLPMFPDLTPDQVDYACDKVLEFFGRKG
ncbi:MAG: DegT/DnrJ/EryC1/StrS family aminotransferase [Verrucomicrobiia bacterium]